MPLSSWSVTSCFILFIPIQAESDPGDQTQGPPSNSSVSPPPNHTPSSGSLVHSQDWNPDYACPDGPLSLAQVSPECQTLGSAAPRSLYMGGSWGVLLNWTTLYLHHLPNLLFPHPPSWKMVASSLELLSQDFGVTLSPHIPSKPWLFTFKNYIKFLGLPRWSSG